MSSIIPAAAPISKGFVYETPDGHQKLTGFVGFDDRAIWAAKDDFDGREVVSATYPMKAGPWHGEGANYKGTTRRLYDLHMFTVDLSTNPGVDVAALLSLGFARSAEVSGPRHGTEHIELQSWGNNAPVYDVGKVNDRGIGWISPVTARRIHKYSESAQVLAPGDAVAFSQSEFGVPGNMRFEIDVFAPELSPRAGVTNLDLQKEVMEKLGLRVESNFFPAGSNIRGMSYINNVGPDGNNARFGFSLADPSIFSEGTPPTGLYKFRILTGDQEVAAFKLAWHT